MHDEYLGLREPPDPGGAAVRIVETFTYNGDGQRVQKHDSTGTTKHVWDGQNILLETDGSNIIQVVYTLQPLLYGNLISQRRSGTTSFYLFDGLGSTTQLANSTGSVTDSYLYDSFGNILLTSGTSVNQFRYLGAIGYYLDADTLKLYVRARYYFPTTGLFVSSDPLDSYIGTYVYALNNPLKWSDPSGRAVEVCCRKTLIPILGSWFGAQHCWVKTRTEAAGRGNIANKCCNSCPCAQTVQTDHLNEKGNCKPAEAWGNWGGPAGYYHDCNEQCVNNELNVGATVGRFFPITSDCIAFVRSVLGKCCQHAPPVPSEGGLPFTSI